MARQIQILTNEESFNIIETVDGVVKKDYDIPYNQVWLSVAENTMTIQIITKQYSTYVNGLYSWYVVDGSTYGSIDELQSALEAKLFKNPEGGGGAKVNVVDELPEVGNEGEFYVLSDTKEMFVYVDGEYIPTAKNGMKQRILTYSNSTNQITDEEGNVMTMEGIKSLVLNTDNFVYMTDDNWVFLLPSLNYFGDAMEFVGTYVLDGYTWTDRVIINSNDEVSEYHLQSEKVENKVSEITDANEESTEQYPSNKAVKEYVATHVEKGMTDDEARTISESLNDLNSRDIALTERVEVLEEQGGGASVEILNYDPTANQIKDNQGNVLSFADVKTKADSGLVLLSYYGGMGIGNPYILNVIGNTSEAVTFALTAQGNDGQSDLISTWTITYTANGEIEYKVVNVSEGQGGGESNVVFYYTELNSNEIKDKDGVVQSIPDVIDSIVQNKNKNVVIVCKRNAEEHIYFNLVSDVYVEYFNAKGLNFVCFYGNTYYSLNLDYAEGGNINLSESHIVYQEGIDVIQNKVKTFQHLIYDWGDVVRDADGNEVSFDYVFYTLQNFNPYPFITLFTRNTLKSYVLSSWDYTNKYIRFTTVDNTNVSTIQWNEDGTFELVETGSIGSEWSGSQAEYDALTDEQKLQYDKYYILED